MSVLVTLLHVGPRNKIYIFFTRKDPVCWHLVQQLQVHCNCVFVLQSLNELCSKMLKIRYCDLSNLICMVPAKFKKHIFLNALNLKTMWISELDPDVCKFWENGASGMTCHLILKLLFKLGPVVRECPLEETMRLKKEDYLDVGREETLKWQDQLPVEHLYIKRKKLWNYKVNTNYL